MGISLIVYKRKYDTCASEGSPFTTRMFYSNVMMYYIRRRTNQKIPDWDNITDVGLT